MLYAYFMDVEIPAVSLLKLKEPNKNLQYKKTNKQTNKKQLILNFLWVICMEIC